MTEEPMAQEKKPTLQEARQHLKAARSAWKKSLEEMLPPGYREQRRAARREMLLAFRSMLDAALEEVDKKIG